MTTVADRDRDELLRALDAELRRLGSPPLDICVVGGAALQALGLVVRPTKDVDIVAIGHTTPEGLCLVRSSPLPDALATAAAAVAKEYSIDPTWLNSGPTDLLDHGLPEGFERRLAGVTYGTTLTVHFASRLDQVCFKSFAAADVAGRHLTDLVSLAPTRDEILFALRWVVRQDSSEAFHSQLLKLLDYLRMGDLCDEL